MVLRGGVTVVQYPESPSSTESGPSGQSSAGDVPSDGVPAFLAKLWKLVDESRTDDLICWGPGGNTFIIKNQIDFARKLLPLYYKHNNMASFIRQLNMYGFHKVVSVEDGSLKCDNEEIQFSHPCFLRGHVFMLQHIKRKIATSRSTTVNSGEEKALLKPELMSKVLTDVKHMKGRQETLDARFTVMKRENEALWREVALLRQKHIKQQQIVNNLIQFLMSLVQPSRNGPLKTGMKRRYQLMINNAAHNGTDNIVNRDSKCARLDSENELDDEENDLVLSNIIDAEGPIIHEVGDQEHVNDISNNANAKTKNKTSFKPTNSKEKSQKMSTSTMLDSYDIGADIIAGEEIPIENVLETVDPMVDENIQIYSDTNDTPVLLQPDQIKREVLIKGKSRKNSGKKTKKQVLTHVSPFSLNSTEASPTLPSNIFDSDEANSQDETFSTEDPQAMLSKSMQNFSEEELNNSSGVLENDLLNSLSTGSYNPNITLSSSSKNKSKTKKHKLQDDNLLRIKEEVVVPDEDAADWNDMTVATLPNENVRPTLNRFHSVVLRDFQNPSTSERKTKQLPGLKINEDVDDHLQNMQSDIDSLLGFLGDHSLETNPIYALFEQENPLYSLSMNPLDIALEKDREAQNDSTSQLISYVRPMSSLGFDDLEMENETDSQQSMENQNSTTPAEDSTLNTPQVQLSEYKFPIDSID